MTTASPSPRRRASDAGCSGRPRRRVVTALIKNMGTSPPRCGARPRRCRSSVAGGHGVLPRHQLVTHHVEPSQRARHEPHVEVRAAVTPPVEMHATDVAQEARIARSTRPITAARVTAHVGRHVGEGVEVSLRRPATASRGANICIGLCNGPVLVLPDERGAALGVARASTAPRPPRRGEAAPGSSGRRGP